MRSLHTLLRQSLYPSEEGRRDLLWPREQTCHLNLNERRVRLEDFDTMGYDAEIIDSLYKNCLFYFTLLKNSRIAYGLFYQIMSMRTVRNLGAEIDVVRCVQDFLILATKARLVSTLGVDLPVAYGGDESLGLEKPMSCWNFITIVDRILS